MTRTPGYWAIIPAAGIGARFHQTAPKQYARINGRTILEHSVQPFLASSKVVGIVIAIAENDFQAKQLPLLKDHRIHFCIGGATRAQSVLNALEYAKSKAPADDWALVHDAARPCLSTDEVSALISATTAQMPDFKNGAILALPVTDTIKKASSYQVESTVDRTDLWHALTPQAFPINILAEALELAIHQGRSVTDECSAIELIGLRPELITGKRSNIKITYPEDIDIATFYLSNIGLMQ